MRLIKDQNYVCSECESILNDKPFAKFCENCGAPTEPERHNVGDNISKEEKKDSIQELNNALKRDIQKENLQSYKNNNSSNISFGYSFTLWTIINGLMLFTFFFGFKILSSQNFSDETGISYIIIILFGMFYALNIYNTFYFRTEQKNLLDCDKPKFNYDIGGIIFSGNGLVAEHISNLEDIYLNLFNGEVNQDLSLEIIGSRLDRREYFVQLGSNIMITLGLIGTITGLIISISGLESVMTSLGEGGEGIIPGLKQALSGMGTAFYTTLFGAILGGFFLKLLHQTTSNMSDEIIDEIALLCEIHLLPHLKVNVENNLNYQSNLQTKFIEQTNSLLDRETKKLNDYVNSVDELKTNIENFNTKIRNIDENIQNNNLTTLQEILETLKDIQKESKPFFRKIFK